MFLEYFDNLREKPKEVRKRYALFLTSALTSCIVIIWLVTIFLGNFGERTLDGGENAKKGDALQEEQSITTLFNSSNSFIDIEPTEVITTQNQYDWEQELKDYDTIPVTQTGTSSDVTQKNASTTSGVVQ